MNKLEIVKKTTSIIVGLGTSKVAGDIIRNNAAPRHMIDKITIGAASVVVGSMAATATQKHTEVMIDEAVEAFQKIKKN